MQLQIGDKTLRDLAMTAVRQEILDQIRQQLADPKIQQKIHKITQEALKRFLEIYPELLAKHLSELFY